MTEIYPRQEIPRGRLSSRIAFLSSRLSSTSREAGRKVKVYHVSPDSDIQVLRGQSSKKFKDRGLFVSPTKKAVFDSWAGYVSGKKHQKHPNRPRDTYESITLYTLEMGIEDLLKAQAYYDKTLDKVYERAKREGREPWELMGSWGWDTEIFISDYILDRVRIVGRKTVHPRDLISWGGRSNTNIKDLRSHPSGKNYAARVLEIIESQLHNQGLKGTPKESIQEIHKKYRTQLAPFIWEKGTYGQYVPRPELTRQEHRAVQKVLRDFETETEQFVR